MELTVNGEERAVPDGATVDVLIASLTGVAGARQSRGVAVAVGGEVVPRSRWELTQLEPGAVVEILTAVQGG